ADYCCGPSRTSKKFGRLLFLFRLFFLFFLVLSTRSRRHSHYFTRLLAKALLVRFAIMIRSLLVGFANLLRDLIHERVGLLVHAFIFFVLGAKDGVYGILRFLCPSQKEISDLEMRWGPLGRIFV